ncbi:hypothetical protein ACIRN4_13265 [Pimelobacter simplex]|uniref:hypothetical protein n=1 Tax=Nocardioides simplex TaxID=2045 RepID=UPI00382AD46C
MAGPLKIAAALATAALLVPGSVVASEATASSSASHNQSAQVSARATTLIPGSIKGKTISLPYGSGWANNRDYGTPSNVGYVMTTFASMAEIEAAARSNGVPWADTDNPTEDHNVYQIWGIRNNGNTVLYKYGITKVSAGTTRPAGQLSNCRSYMQNTIGDQTPSCTWAWVRRNTSNFMRARRVEAAYITEYKIRNGHCPPGALSCK